MSGDTITWLNGHQADFLPLPDRATDFGDGLFETLLLKRGQPLYLERHLARLSRGSAALFFPTDAVQMVTETIALAKQDIAAIGWPWSVLRVTLSRGAGPRGYAPPVICEPRTLATATRLEHNPLEIAEPARIGLASICWPIQPALAGLKHLNRLEQVLAAREYRLQGLDEALMLDHDGNVISVTSGNLFAVVEGEIVTPKLEQTGIQGTRRQCVIEDWAPALGKTVSEVQLSLAQLKAAKEVFLTNTLLGLRPISAMKNIGWERDNVCTSLFQHYRDSCL
ncbi:MAG: aminodeoxychorismate lyase [Pseudomonadota bacterium]